MSHDLNVILRSGPTPERCPYEMSRAKSIEQTLTTWSACSRNPWKWLLLTSVCQQQQQPLLMSFFSFLAQITLSAWRAPPLPPRMQQRLSTSLSWNTFFQQMEASLHALFFGALFFQARKAYLALQLTAWHRHLADAHTAPNFVGHACRSATVF